VSFSNTLACLFIVEFQDFFVTQQKLKVDVNLKKKQFGLWFVAKASTTMADGDYSLKI